MPRGAASTHLRSKAAIVVDIRHLRSKAAIVVDIRNRCTPRFPLPSVAAARSRPSSPSTPIAIRSWRSQSEAAQADRNPKQVASDGRRAGTVIKGPRAQHSDRDWKGLHQEEPSRGVGNRWWPCGRLRHDKRCPKRLPDSDRAVQLKGRQCVEACTPIRRRCPYTSGFRLWLGVLVGLVDRRPVIAHSGRATGSPHRPGALEPQQLRHLSQMQRRREDGCSAHMSQCW